MMFYFHNWRKILDRQFEYNLIFLENKQFQMKIYIYLLKTAFSRFLDLVSEKKYEAFSGSVGNEMFIDM